MSKMLTSSKPVVAAGLILLTCGGPVSLVNAAPKSPAAISPALQPLADGAGLFQAVSADNISALDAALRSGADVNTADKDGKTALMLAADLGRTDLVQTLLDHKADPNLRDPDGRSALHYVLMATNPEPVKKKRHGLSGLLNTVKSLGGTALTMAPMALVPGGALLESVAGGVISQGLAGASARRQALTGTGNVVPSAFAAAGPEMLAKLSDLGDAATPEEQAQWHTFLEALKDGNQEKVQEMQANPDFAPVLAKAADRMQAMTGQTPGADGGAGIVQALLAHGADPSLTDKGGKTPLQSAQDRNLPIVARLLEHPVGAAAASGQASN